MSEKKEFWIDTKGQSWPVARSEMPLRFSIESHRALRIYIHQRAKFTCQYCGVHPRPSTLEYATFGYDGKSAIRWKEPSFEPGIPRWKCPNNEFQIDHIIPRQDGGSNHPDNLQLLCHKCNVRKKRYEHIWQINKKKGTPNDYKNWTLQWVPGEANA